MKMNTLLPAELLCYCHKFLLSLLNLVPDFAFICSSNDDHLLRNLSKCISIQIMLKSFVFLSLDLLHICSQADIWKYQTRWQLLNNENRKKIERRWNRTEIFSFLLKTIKCREVNRHDWIQMKSERLQIDSFFSWFFLHNREKRKTRLWHCKIINLCFILFHFGRVKCSPIK